ncbi:Subunit of heteropentameric Replication factor C (RF-C) [Perkinsus olseni]|uniref:Subunit of heteropentameric Replication factor C (RF-C) n=1 Tax=Perkinsus olseni TaxID=32597 RepID=A0A7J6Q2C0_PEROL|nr:Subunit of heteropentameric Replication factor C (RF-C) [Perkinsus olseni]
MSFLVDTERPQKLDELTFHPSLTRTLKKLAASKDCPHLLFYGPSGGGKMTRIRCLLEGMFGPGAEKTSTSFRQFKATTSTTVDIQVVVSAFHVEVTPSDVGIRDAAVIQQLIKQMAENPPVGEVPFHVVVINDAHCLTRQAQAALRRTMEKYVSKIRFIFHADSLSPLIPPLRSRCLGIRVPRPTPDELQRDMMNISQRHALGLNPGLCARIVEESGCDARLALIRLDVLRRKNVTLSDSHAVIEKQSWKVQRPRTMEYEKHRKMMSAVTACHHSKCFDKILLCSGSYFMLLMQHNLCLSRPSATDLCHLIHFAVSLHGTKNRTMFGSPWGFLDEFAGDRSAEWQQY